MILTVKTKNQLIALSFLFFVSAGMLVLNWIKDFETGLVLISLGVLVLITVPTAYLHIEYYLRNRWTEFEINPEGLIATRRNGERERHAPEQIERIIIYKSASIDTGGIQMTPMESYHYVRVCIRGGKELILTCLLSPKIDVLISQLSGVPIERRKRGFCTIKWK